MPSERSTGLKHLTAAYVVVLVTVAWAYMTWEGAEPPTWMVTTVWLLALASGVVLLGRGAISMARDIMGGNGGGGD
jgi:hypothetical protein